MTSGVKMKRRVCIMVWMLMLGMGFSACGQNSVMNKASLPKQNQTETTKPSASSKAASAEASASSQKAGAEASASSQTASMEASASSQTASESDHLESQGNADMAGIVSKGGMNRFVNSISSSFGSLAYDGKQLFSVENDGKVIVARPLDAEDKMSEKERSIKWMRVISSPLCTIRMGGSTGSFNHRQRQNAIL
jgi:hypothetical protein